MAGPCIACGCTMTHALNCPGVPHGVLETVINPVTRSVAKVVPPIEIDSRRDLEMFSTWLTAYCKACWTPALIDPDVIDASNWRDGLAVSL